MRKLLFIFAIFLVSGLHAQDLTFKVQAPKVVRGDERFYLTYELSKDVSNFKPGDLSDFNVLHGPSRSSSTSVSIINGRMEQKVSISFSYILSPKKEGKFTIGPATVTVDGKEHRSDPVAVEVVKGNTQARQQNQQQGHQQEAQPSNEISDKDLFVRITVDRTSLYKGEPIIATAKLYTRVQLEQLSDVKIPQFNGFWREDLERKDNVIKWEREQFDGELYHTGVIAEFVLIPQRAGKLTVDPVDLEVVAIQEVRTRHQRRSIFDDFFDMGSSYQRVKKNLKSSPIMINVKEVPATADITGNIKMQSKLSKTEVKANESVSLKITLSGKGNLKMVQPFKLDLPPDLEAFDPEVSQNIKVTTNGLTGTKTFEYLIIPRHAGTFMIPSVELHSFDPATGKLVKLRSDEYELKVARGENEPVVSGVDHSRSQSDIRYIGKDIRYIKTGNIALGKASANWFGSTSFYLTYFAGPVCFAFLFLLMRTRRKELEDVAGYRKRKAANMAKKRLKTAEQYLKENDRGKFYSELLRAISQYLEDKLNKTTADMSKEKIKAALTAGQASEATINKLIAIMEKCEMAQYTPMGNKVSLSDDHLVGLDVICSLEEEIKA